MNLLTKGDRVVSVDRQNVRIVARQPDRASYEQCIQREYDASDRREAAPVSQHIAYAALSCQDYAPADWQNVLADIWSERIRDKAELK